jgi:class 3 adenylate cyclase
LGPLQVRRDGLPVAIPGAKPRAILTMLGLHDGSVVSADALVELLWGDDPPRTAVKALQTHISSLRRGLGDGFVLTQGAGWALAETEVDATRYKAAARSGRDATAGGDDSRAVVCFDEALALWRGIPELPDGRRGTTEKTRWIEAHAALVEDRADALLATGRAAEIVGELEAAVADAPLRERRWGQLMLALYRAGRQGEALGAYQRARALLADELGVDPGPNLRRLEALIVAQDGALEVPATQRVSSVTRAVTFLLTDIEGSTAAWEADAEAMATALARHDELVEQVVTSRGGRLIKTRGEGDATFSVFERPSAAAAAAIELQDAIVHEPWVLSEPMRVRVALHTGEAELRDGDYFGRAVNRAARLRSLAAGGQILCSGATAELVIDSLPDDVALVDRGRRELKNLARPEHVFELRLETADETHQAVCVEAPVERPSLPAVLAGPGPFVGRGNELQRLFSAWQTALAAGTNAVLIAGEPGVGKTRLAGEWSRQAYDQGALVIYGRCDEDLGAPYQPFAEALRALLPCLGARGLRGLRGVEALLALVPGLTEILPDLAAPTRADPDTERYALFDAVVAVLGVASASAPVVLILDDLHWAAKPTLLLLRHLLRFGEQARVQIIGTYRSTDLDRSHPLAAMLADLHRDGSGNRIQLSGLDEDDVTAYVAEAGYHDEELARALASVTGGNPFFLIEALRHVDESGGRWDQSTLPQGVREAVSRRLTRLLPETNKALAAAAVVGSRFALELVESVVGDDLVDAFDEACKAGIVIEEPGGRYRFNHALVRQSLLAELPSVRRMRLHQRIAATLESQPGADDELLAELAHHYFECAWAGNAAKAVEYCRRAADQAMARLAYEGAADLYDHALHALEEIDDELPDRDDQAAELLVARCEALLAAGDVASAAGAVSQLEGATVDSARLAAWATCFDGQLSMLIHPERLDEAEAALAGAAAKLAELDDAAGEAKAHTVRAGCLARLGRIGDCEIALDDALTAARRAREHRRVNSVLANAPLAALWGPNPVPRAGGRCLDVVRLLRITTDSPAVEATSTRCQAVLEAFRGRAPAARRMIDSARRTVTELGLRHALLEVEQFAGIVELVVDEPAAAEPHLLKAYNGFRRMGLDADTAETAALLGRACLALDRDAEADELCTESERLAGHALKPSIAWRTLRARLLSRRGEHVEARRVAQAAVSLAERTDALVDHADACLALATVLGAAGDVTGARAAAERAVDLYERKGAAALAERARGILGERVQPVAEAPPEAPSVELDNAAARVGERVMAAIHRGAWDEVEQLFAPDASIESRRKIVGLTLSTEAVLRAMRRELEMGIVRIDHVMVAARGERLALSRMMTSSPDVSPGAPRDELLQLYAINEEGQVAWQVWFDVEDIDDAMAELDAAHARLEAEHRDTRRLENAAARVFEHVWSHYATRDWDALAHTVADNYVGIDRRRVVSAETQHGRDPVVRDLQAAAQVGFAISMVSALAIRGERLVLARVRASGRDPEAIQNDALNVVEIDDDERIANVVTFDLDDFDAAIAELDARYAAGEAAEYARTWAVISGALVAHNRREIAPATKDVVTIDHRRVAAFAPGEGLDYIRAGWDLDQKLDIYIEAVHRVSELGAVFTWAGIGVSHDGFAAEWRSVDLMMVDGEMLSRGEVFDEEDVDAAIARFDQLCRPARRLENAASHMFERMQACFTARDWDALADTLVDDFHNEDRRRVVNGGVVRGRAAAVDTMRWAADLGITHATSNVIATRGERLALARAGYAQGDENAEAFGADVLQLAEIGADERLAAIIVFDCDDFDAAVAELEARYIAGEAATYSRTWSVISNTFATHNRREIVSTTADVASIDHRRVAAFAPGEGLEYIRAGWNLHQKIDGYIEKVHRLSELGAVFTWAGNGTSHEGFAAEWRGVNVLMVDGELLSRAEVFEEEDVDAALARFDQLGAKAPRLENAASQAYERVQACFAARDWDAMANAMAQNMVDDDRRHIVNAGIRRGRDIHITNSQAVVEIGGEMITSTVVATRGARLALCRSSILGQGQQSGGFRIEFLSIVESDADERLAGHVAFDLDDFDTATAELDGRYLAGEATAHAHTWSVLSGAYAALNRREHPPTTADWVSVDHRRGLSFPPGAVSALLANWNTTADLSNFVEAVHRLTDLGAVVTSASRESSPEGFDAEWRGICVLTVEGDLIDRLEVFDETDLEAALTRFEQLSQPAPRLKNAATRAYDRLQTHHAACEWAAITEMLSDNYISDDRRAVVGGGIQHGRDALIENLRAVVDVGVTRATSDTIATRGGRLALTHARYSRSHEEPATFRVEFLQVVEVDADERITALAAFDRDDIGAAIAELDARYLAGEAAAHSHTWKIVADSYAALNRHELPRTAPNCVNIDHRRETAFGPGDVTEYIRAGRDSDEPITIYVEEVHRLSGLGAVITYAAHETTHEGFDAEWRGIAVLTIDVDLVDRLEVFDESDLETAIARFGELGSQTRRLENTASQVGERYLAHFAAADWVAMTELLADNFSNEDRRRMVGVGVRHGRSAQIADMQAIADLFSTQVTPTTIATRGAHLALMRLRFSAGDHGPEAFLLEADGVLEINADRRIVAVVFFDADDTGAAFEELDRRYLTGEAAAHARTWSFVTSAYAAFNRRKVPATTPNCVYIDHRRLVRIEDGGLGASLRALWEQLTPQARIYIESVHRLSDLGAVVTHTAHATSREGFDAEWREINLLTAEGDLVNRCELFDETDLDAALARFEDLRPQSPRLENAASRTFERFLSHFAARDWDAMAATPADNFAIDDRRRVVNAGIRHGRANAIHDWRAAAGVGFSFEVVGVIATRGERIALLRVRASGRDPESIRNDAFNIIETDADERVVGAVVFDLDDIDAAFAELDARYLAGEAAAHAHTWSVVSDAYAAMNRHELFPTPSDWVNRDHRRPGIIEDGGLNASLRSLWELIPDLTFRIEAVHRLTDLGAVCSHVARGVSRDGFDAEWRGIEVITVDRDLINRCEIFDATDLDAAIAHFAELQPPTRRLENTASRVHGRLKARIGAGDWSGVGELLADDIAIEDRRRAVNSGIQRGRDAAVADMRSAIDLGLTDISLTVIATRGDHLELCRTCISYQDQPEAFRIEFLSVLETNADDRIVSRIAFDLNDIDAAFEELDARYVAGDAAAHADIWSVVAKVPAQFNRHELFTTTPDPAYIDHRRLVSIEGADLASSVRAVWDITSDASVHIEAVHRLSERGALFTEMLKMTSRDGFDAEVRMLMLFIVDGGLISRVEVFDEADLDAALTRFNELQPRDRRLGNAASRLSERFFAHVESHDWDAMAEIVAEKSFFADRRRVVNLGVWHGRDLAIANMRVLHEIEANVTLTVIATRGERLALARVDSLNRDLRHGEFDVELLSIVEADAENRIATLITFDPNDIDTAFAELDARYLAGEAAAHARTWSVLMRAFAALNRHEVPAITPDWVRVDHRSLAPFEAGDWATFLHATWDVTPNLISYVEVVHRLGDFGAVVTHVAHGTSQDGMDAEWRIVDIFTVDGDLVSGAELFDEADLDTALARFDELDRSAVMPENAATRIWSGLADAFNRRDLDGFFALTAADLRYEDRRKGLRDEFEGPARRKNMQAMFEAAPSGSQLTVEPIAIRGEHLSLTRARYGDPEDAEAPTVEMLQITEVGEDGLLHACVSFDPDDIDAAFAELAARWVSSGEDTHPDGVAT